MERLTTLTHLPDTWDDEGAPKPNSGAIARAEPILRWALAQGFTDVDVDPDGEGGVNIIVHQDDRQVWFACMNSGRDTVVWAKDRKVVGHQMFLGDPDQWLSFLQETSR